MSIKEIESPIQQLSVWLADYQSGLWEDQISGDLDAGRLDEVLDQVDAECQEGKAKPL